jgi:hypothetical protein
MIKLKICTDMTALAGYFDTGLKVIFIIGLL